MTFITFALVVCLVVYLSKQSDRVRRLETGLAELKQRLEKISRADLKPAPSASAAFRPEPARTAPPPAAPRPMPVPEPPAYTPPQAPKPVPVMAEAIVQPLPAPVEPEPASPIDWEQFAGVNLFAWIGGFALFLGAGFFVKYSIEHGLLSPIIRVTLSFLLGGGCVAAGLWLKESRYGVTAQTLCAAGVAILYAAVFAAGAIYHFIGSGPSFVLMSLVTAASFFLAVRMDSKYVALLGLIGGFLTPPLLSTGVDRPFALFGYILLLDAGVAATIFRTGWTFLLPLCLLGTGAMEIGWFDKFFTPAKVLTGVLVTALFAAFTSAFITLAPKYGIDEKKAGFPGGLFLMFCIFLDAAMFLTGNLASTPALLFTLLLSINALFAWHAYKSRYFMNWQSAASLFVFLILASWSADELSPGLLGQAFVVYLVFSALNAALPVVAWKLRGEKRGELAFAGLYPVLGLALVLLAMLRQTSVSFLFWPVVLLLDLFAIGASFLASTLWVAAVCLALTVVGGFIWLGKISQVAALGGFMAVFALFTVAFLALAVFLLRKVKEGGETMSLENKEVAEYLPYLTAIAPYLLIITAAVRLKPDDPSMIFGFGLLMSVVMLAFARLYSLGGLALPALAGSFALAVAWHTVAFEPERSLVPFIWYADFILLFGAFPLAFKERFKESKPVWTAAPIAGLLFFLPVYDVVSRALGRDLIGLLPAAFAALYFLMLLYIIKHKGVSDEVHNYKLALAGGVTLFFVTLIFPLQFDKQWITLGWALEGAALVWLYGRVPHEGLKKWGYTLLLLSFFRLAFNGAVFSYHPRQGMAVFNWYLYTYLTAAAAMFAAALKWRPEDEKIMSTSVKGALLACGTALLFLLLNIEIADYFSTGTTLTFQFSGNVARDMAYTLGWSLFAAVLFVFGMNKGSTAARKAGIGIFAMAILKLFLHDVWSLGQLYRVAAFMVTAVILIVVSFLYQKNLSEAKKNAPVKENA